MPRRLVGVGAVGTVGTVGTVLTVLVDFLLLLLEFIEAVGDAHHSPQSRHQQQPTNQVRLLLFVRRIFSAFFLEAFDVPNHQSVDEQRRENHEHVQSVEWIVEETWECPKLQKQLDREEEQDANAPEMARVHEVVNPVAVFALANQDAWQMLPLMSVTLVVHRAWRWFVRMRLELLGLTIGMGWVMRLLQVHNVKAGMWHWPDAAPLPSTHGMHVCNGVSTQTLSCREDGQKTRPALARQQ